MGHAGSTASSVGVAAANDLHASTAGIFLSSSLYNLNDYWILDTNATNHMTNRDDWLVDKKLLSETKVQLSIGGYSTVNSVGTYIFKSDKKLQNVLYVLAFKYNFLSVSKVTNDLNCFPKFILSLVFCRTSQMGEVLGNGKQDSLLYFEVFL